MKRLWVVTLVLVLCLSGSSRAFDGQRRGFVLGGGLGLAPTGTYKLNLDLGWLGDFSLDRSGSGVGLNIVIGGAFNEQNMLVYEGNVMAWSDDLMGTNIAQGFNGAAFYHYFGPVGKSAFLAGGLGFYVFDADFWEADPGFGVMVGGGYEFSKHWQVGGYFSFGKTSYLGVDFDHHHINLLVSGIAF